MVLRHPVAVVAELFAALGQEGAVGDGVGGALAATDGRLIENAESDGQGNPLGSWQAWYGAVGSLSREDAKGQRGLASRSKQRSMKNDIPDVA